MMFPNFLDMKIVSGCQTGADRAALDWAIENHVEHGGWCPRGRLSEDGTIPAQYQLKETPSAEYPQRTEWNVRDSDATVIFSLTNKLSHGSKKTATLATKLGKPLLHLTPGSVTPSEALSRFIQHHNVKILNVAGPRASNEPGVGAFVKSVLDGWKDLSEKFPDEEPKLY